MFSIATVAITLSILLALGRAFAGPTVYDRILATNLVSTNTVLLIAVLGFLTGRPDFLDLAVLYAMLGFAAAIAVLKFVWSGSVADASELEREISEMSQE